MTTIKEILQQIYVELKENKNLRNLEGTSVDIEDFIFRWYRLAFFYDAKYNYMADMAEDKLVEQFYDRLADIIKYYSPSTIALREDILPSKADPKLNHIYDFVYKRKNIETGEIIKVAERKSGWRLFLIDEIADEFDGQEILNISYPWVLQGPNLLSWINENKNTKNQSGLTVIEDQKNTTPGPITDHKEKLIVQELFALEKLEGGEGAVSGIIEIDKPEMGGKLLPTEVFFQEISPRLKKLNPVLVEIYEKEIKNIIAEILSGKNDNSHHKSAKIYLKEKAGNKKVAQDEFVIETFFEPLVKK